MNTTQRTLPGLALLGLIACGTEPQRVTATLQADRFAGSEWSEPVNLGPVINSSAVDANAGLSSDAHTLFFVSTRAGGLGNLDIWMSHRQCLSCDWEAPVNLGAPINSDAIDAAPTMSDDGRLLFFYSARSGGFGLGDVYVSHRVSTGADGDVWGPPVNLGPDVNTAANEQGSFYVHEPGEPNAFVYFNRLTPGGSVDIYRVAVSNDGEAVGRVWQLRHLALRTSVGARPVVESRAPGRADQHARPRVAAGAVARRSDVDLHVDPARGVRPPGSVDVHTDAERSLKGD
ncbi:MAG: hypothetical protein AUG74_02445 [Bacteroidetes bacterium 13_1_20CM_4_60_6]|nr:MAG: hypothetical protein AUG74_02445 [Bacteroidetes bacterium 13_1_20CM_4_60_6]